MNAQEMIRSNVIIAAAKDAAKIAPPVVVNETERTTLAWDAKVAFEENDFRLNQFETHLFLISFASTHAQRQARAFIKGQILAMQAADRAEGEPKYPTPLKAHRATRMIAAMQAFLV